MSFSSSFLQSEVISNLKWDESVVHLAEGLGCKVAADPKNLTLRDPPL